MKKPSTTLNVAQNTVFQRNSLKNSRNNFNHTPTTGALGKAKIGIVGYGMVGGAVGAKFTTAAIYDPKKFPDGWPAVNACNIEFNCVPTPYKKTTRYDYRAIDATAKRLTGHKIVVLKSTILPGKTAELQKRFPRHTWLFNPEFLRDKTAVQDFLKPDRQIVGAAQPTAKHRVAAKLVMSLLPRAPFRAVVTSTEAELIKLFANAFLATKVVFANMLYDVCRQIGADFEPVKLGVGRDPRITTSMMNVILDGYRGYSGKCFPKDVGALIWFGRHTKHRLPLLETADAMNWKLLPKSHRHR